MTRFGHGAALAGLVLAGAVACSRKDATPAAATSATAAAAPPASAAPPTGLTLPTVTSASIATSNLDGELDDARKRVDRGEDAFFPRFIERLLMRAQYTGADADLTEADDRTKKDVTAHPKDGAAHQRRAGVLSSLHEFTAAEAELELAVANGVPKEGTARARGTIAIARGEYDRAAELLGPADGATIDLLPILGALAQHRGNALDGDALFEKARTTYRDVSPFFVAWMDFERARALERSGDGKRAKLYFREAVTLLPPYTHAASHLAALEAPEVALEVLAPFAASTEPGVLAARADAQRRAGKASEAEATTEAAKARFVVLLKTHPKAYADHAATFFLGAGKDVAYAVTLARANAENRPNEEALELWLTAAEANKGPLADRCGAAAKIKALRYVDAALAQRATAAAKDCP